MQPVASADCLFSGNIADGRHLLWYISRKIRKMRVRPSSTGYSSRQPNTFLFLVTRLPADLPVAVERVAGSIGGGSTVFEATALRFPYMRLKDTASSICWVHLKVTRAYSGQLWNKFVTIRMTLNTCNLKKNINLIFNFVIHYIVEWEVKHVVIPRDYF